MESSRPKQCFLLGMVLVAIAGITAIGFVVCVTSAGLLLRNQRQVETQAPTSVEFGSIKNVHEIHEQDGKKRDLGGTSRGNGLSIDWRSTDYPNGASPLDVCEALLSRLSHLQTTDLGSDRYARALWEIQKAKDILSDDASSVGTAPTSEVGAGFTAPQGGTK